MWTVHICTIRVDILIKYLMKKGMTHENPHLTPIISAVFLAAILPGAPITPPPGWVPDPHSSRLLTGVTGPGLKAAVGLVR